MKTLDLRLVGDGSLSYHTICRDESLLLSCALFSSIILFVLSFRPCLLHHPMCSLHVFLILAAAKKSPLFPPMWIKVSVSIFPCCILAWLKRATCICSHSAVCVMGAWVWMD